MFCLFFFRDSLPLGNWNHPTGTSWRVFTSGCSSISSSLSYISLCQWNKSGRDQNALVTSNSTSFTDSIISWNQYVLWLRQYSGSVPMQCCYHYLVLQWSTLNLCIQLCIVFILLDFYKYSRWKYDRAYLPSHFLTVHFVSLNVSSILFFHRAIGNQQLSSSHNTRCQTLWKTSGD